MTHPTPRLLFPRIAAFMLVGNYQKFNNQMVVFRPLVLHLRHGGGYFIAAMENALGLGAVAEDGGGKGCGKDNDTGFHNNLRG